MTNPVPSQRRLTVLALTALAAYVLACASFSPDDSMVAFPTLDPKTSETGVAVFHRQSGRTEQVFAMARLEEAATGDPRPLRAQWLDNQRLVVAWAGTGGSEHNGLSLLSLPITRKGPAVWRTLDGIDDMDQKLIDPLALAGSDLLVPVESNLVARLNLGTGKVEVRPCRGSAVGLYPAQSADHVYYLARDAAKEGTFEMGRLEAATFKQTPLLQVDAAEVEKEARVAFSKDGRQVAWATDKGGTQGVCLAEPGQPTRFLPASARVEVARLGNLCFSHKQALLYAAFAGRAKPEARLSLGVLEIPLDGRPVQHTFVLEGTAGMDRDAVMYFQITLSHDGRALAASTAYLLGEKTKPAIQLADSGLFLVDVTTWPHKIVRVPPPGL